MFKIYPLLLSTLLLASSHAQTIYPSCGESTVSIKSTNTASLSNPSYSINPGGFVFTTSSYVMPATAGAYTLYTTGLTAQNVSSAQTTPFTIISTQKPLLASSTLTSSCGNAIVAITVSPMGSLVNPALLIWNPTPASLNTNSTMAFYQKGGQFPATVTITGTDAVGCTVSTTAIVPPYLPPPSFTVNSLSGNFNITCVTPTLNLSVTTNTTFNNGASLKYLWAGNGNTITTANINITNPGMYTITVQDTLTNCSSSQQIGVNVYTVAPSSTVNPLSQTITCNASPQSFSISANLPANNINQQILSPFGGIVSLPTSTALYGAIAVGVYTHFVVNVFSGCKTTKTFTIFSNQSFPSFSITSPQNYTLGCSTKSIATISLLNGVSNPTGNVVSYTLVGPGSPTYPITGPLSTSINFTCNLPGTYTAVVRDVTAGCDTRVPFSVFQNATPPSIAFPQLAILNCTMSQFVLEVISSAANSSYVWSNSSNPSLGTSYSFAVNANTAVPTQSALGIYSVMVTDNSNLCVKSATVPVYQNLYPPTANVSPSAANISCASPSVILVNISTSNIPPNAVFPVSQAIVGLLWQGPSPQVTVGMSTTYPASVPGTYTFAAQDLNNGCISQKTFAVIDNRDFPLVNSPTSAFIINCPNKQPVTIYPISYLNGPSYTYSWTSPPNAVFLGGLTGGSLTTASSGIYTIAVKNILSGCVTSATVALFECVSADNFDRYATTIKVFPNPSNGVFQLELNELTSDAVIEVYSVTGELIKTERLKSIRQELNIASESNGVYLIQVVADQQVRQRLKIVKQ